MLLTASVAVVVTETYVRSAVEAEIAKDLKRYYNLEELPFVEVHGSPFFWKILSGRFSSVRAEMKNLDTSQFASGKDRFASPLKITSMEIILNEIQFSPLRVLGGQNAFTAASGELTASISERYLNEYMKNSGVKVTFTIFDDQVLASATLVGQGKSYSVEGRGYFKLENDSLNFVPVSVDGNGISDQVAINALTITRPSPGIGGLKPTAVTIAKGELILSADVSTFTFESSGDSMSEMVPPAPNSTLTPSAAPTPSPTLTPGSPAKSPTRSPARSPTPTRRRN